MVLKLRLKPFQAIIHGLFRPLHLFCTEIKSICGFSAHSPDRRFLKLTSGPVFFLFYLPALILVYSHPCCPVFLFFRVPTLSFPLKHMRSCSTTRRSCSTMETSGKQRSLPTYRLITSIDRPQTRAHTVYS